MRTSDQHSSGGREAPAAFGAGAARRVPVPAAVGCRAAQAQQLEGCRYITQQPDPRRRLRRARYVRRAVDDPGRPLGLGARAPAARSRAARSCAPAEIAKGVLRIGLAPFYPPSDDYQLRRETEQQAASPVEFALHPRAIGDRAVEHDATSRRAASMPETDITPDHAVGHARHGARRHDRFSRQPGPWRRALRMQDRLLRAVRRVFPRGQRRRLRSTNCSRSTMR